MTRTEIGIGYVSSASEININTVSEAKIKQLKAYQEKAEIFVALCEALKKFEGKKVTRRVTEGINSTFEDVTVSFAREKVFKHVIKITFWSRINQYSNDRFSFTFPGDEPFNMEQFKKNNEWYDNGVYETIAKIEDVIKNTKKYVDEYNAKAKAFNIAYKALEAATRPLQ